VTSVASSSRESSIFPGFSVHIDRDPGHPTIADVYLSGDLDVDSTYRLADTMNTLIDQGSTTIRLNLAKIGFIDAAGLQSLIAANILARRHNGQLIITGASASVQRLMTLISPTSHM
jgi:anti-anti-sigma factor